MRDGSEMMVSDVCVKGKSASFSILYRLPLFSNSLGEKKRHHHHHHKNNHRSSDFREPNLMGNNGRRHY